MDSKKRSKILYDDPNSMFKANRTVYLHELQGSTLRSKKPLPDDIDAGLKTSESIVKLISRLSQLQVIVDMFYSVFFDADGERAFTYSPTGQSVKEAVGLITSSNVLIKQMLKAPQSSFSEDDIFSILQLYQDLNEKMQYITESIVNAHPKRGRVLYSFFYGTIYKNFHNKIKGLFDQLDKLLPYANISGISLPDITPPQPIEDDGEFQDAQQPPEDYEVAPPLEGAGRHRRSMCGSGRYNVLSTRMSKIQQHPYKRFL
jgi:hypothetical protein